MSDDLTRLTQADLRTFGKHARRRRDMLGLTAGDVAGRITSDPRHADVDEHVVIGIERGEADPAWTLLAAHAKALQLPRVADLARGTDSATGTPGRP